MQEVGEGVNITVNAKAIASKIEEWWQSDGTMLLLQYLVYTCLHSLPYKHWMFLLLL